MVRPSKIYTHTIDLYYTVELEDMMEAPNRVATGHDGGRAQQRDGGDSGDGGMPEVVVPPQGTTSGRGERGTMMAGGRGYRGVVTMIADGRGERG